MTPGARIAAAIEVLSDLEARHRPVASALKDWGLSHRFAGSKDRAAIGNIVYDALRQRRSLAAEMAADTPRALVLGVVGRLWGEGADGLSAMLEAPHAPEPLSSEELSRIADGVSRETPDAANVPDWVVASLVRGLGEGWVAEMQAMAERPPLDIRVNRLKADRQKVARALARHPIVEMAYAPDGLRIAATRREERHPNIQADPAFQKGWFEIQDEGSQLAALMMGAEPGEQVLDLCAGGGGKTLALAARMANKGQVHASDSDQHRLAPIFDRLRRAGTRNVQVHAAGESLEGLRGRMDRVLVDAPCSGSGTWRRHPDAKWRLSERSVADRVAEQAALLRQAAGFVRPGGSLAYVTCSLLAEENEEQITAFLEEEPSFRSVSSADTIANAGLEPDVAARLLEAIGGRPATGILLTPKRTATDGFFIAVMRRGE